MNKYLKYFISTLILVLAIYVCSQGSHYPTYFFIGFSLFVILGDVLFKKDVTIEDYTYPRLINLPIYLNLPLLIILLFTVIFIFGNHSPILLINIFNTYLYIDLLNIKNSVTFLDKISLIALASLFIGIIGTVPGHELVHRKKNKFDMLFGNWLLAISWDCAFAIEHVYGHHKNVCLPSDPATAKRNEKLYGFILRAIFQEIKDAWIIETNLLKRKGYNPYGIKNRLIIGYLRSLLITIIAYLTGGLIGMFFYLLCAFIAKSFLEAINYIEHYGLVREHDRPVCQRHSWNSNNFVSSILLYNVTRHSAHHEKSNLKFWELEPYPEAPTLPQGYLGMLYIAIFSPYFYRKIMAKKIIQWDKYYATPEERNIAMEQNKTNF